MKAKTNLDIRPAFDPPKRDEFTDRQWRTLATFDRATREALSEYHYAVIRSAERDRVRRNWAAVVLGAITTALVISLAAYLIGTKL